jgi:hypothetical protein
MQAATTLAGFVAAVNADGGSLQFETGATPIALEAPNAQTLNLECDGTTNNLCSVESRLQAFVNQKIAETVVELKDWANSSVRRRRLHDHVLLRRAPLVDDFTAQLSCFESLLVGMSLGRVDDWSLVHD